MFDGLPFILHVTTDLGKSLERLLAPDAIGKPVVPLGGAVLTADYAATQPALIGRLAEAGVPFTVEPQSMRFASPRFQSVRRVASLPYAPTEVLDPARWTDAHERMVGDALRFQAEIGVTHYMVPALPYERPTPERLNTHRGIHELALSLIGTDGIPRRPIIAMAVPGALTIRSPFAVFSLLSDRAFDGVYIQPMRLDPKDDSVEGLVRYVRFVELGRQEALPILAGRVGVFGLLLNALGVDAFDSGLGDHEAFDLRSLTRPPKENGSGGGGQRDRRVYLPKLLTTLPEARARLILASRTLRPQFACETGQCRLGFDAMIDGARSHCLHSRADELAALRALPTRGMRLEHVESRLQTAVETARVVNRVLGDDGQPPIKFEHLDRWLAVLARVEERRLKEAG